MKLVIFNYQIYECKKISLSQTQEYLKEYIINMDVHYPLLTISSVYRSWPWAWDCGLLLLIAWFLLKISLPPSNLVFLTPLSCSIRFLVRLFHSISGFRLFATIRLLTCSLLLFYPWLLTITLYFRLSSKHIAWST